MFDLIEKYIIKGMNMPKSYKKEDNYKYRFTVLTPTYNRARLLPNLYYSLRNQSFSDFEWLVIDDGSCDCTEELFKKWMSEDNAFSIRYYKKENGGKHTAVNYGLNLAQGELFFVMDSDDYLTRDALQKLDGWFIEIAGDNTLAGVAGNRGHSPSETVNHSFQEAYLDKSTLEMSSYQEDGKFVINGERAFCVYTDIHRKYMYPVFRGERFVTEAVAYNRMAHDGYKFRFYNDIIWIYEYREDGLTMSGSQLFINNPRGYGCWLREKAEFEHVSIFAKFLIYYTFTCDLSEYHSVNVIAESLNTSRILVFGMKMLHKMRIRLRDLKSRMDH